MRPTPSPRLELPEYVVPRLGDRVGNVVDHGFGEGRLALSWWNGELADLVKDGLPEVRVGVDPNENGSAKLTRGELFTLARTLDSDADDASILFFLCHVLLWGSGKRPRNNRRRLRSFTGSDATGRIGLLREAALAARAGERREAYSMLIRPGRAAIPYLGPAFYTKYLYFVSAEVSTNPCYILDARVAESLYDRGRGWSDISRTPARRGQGWSFSFNWYTDTYVGYCELLDRWALAASKQIGVSVAADEIERALFDGPPPTTS